MVLDCFATRARHLQNARRADHPHPAFDTNAARGGPVWKAARLGLSDPDTLADAMRYGAEVLGVTLDPVRLAVRLGVGRSAISAACAEYGYILGCLAQGNRRPSPTLAIGL